MTEVARVSGSPSTSARMAVAAAIATAAAVLAYLEPGRAGGDPGDLQQVWMGAVALVRGLDPYQAIGPGRTFEHDFHFLYPLPASLIILPLAALRELPAAVVFVWISTGLLAFGITADGWHRLPLFLSSAFVIAARRVQWAPLLTAAMQLPSLAWVLIAKPNIGLALLLAGRSKRVVIVAIAGGAALVLLSLLLLPTWPAGWLEAVGTARHTEAPIFQRGGFLVLLALLRWRRWEARLIVALACVPQSLFWYDVLPLLLVAQTFRESLILSLVSSLGFILDMLFLQELEALAYYRRFGALLIAIAYMPAVLLVLRRPNEGPVPMVIERGVQRLTSAVGLRRPD
jgi:hypothetical protein